MEFPVHLRCSAVVAIVDCPDQGQFIGFLSLKQAALQSIWVFQESLIACTQKKCYEVFLAFTMLAYCFKAVLFVESSSWFFLQELGVSPRWTVSIFGAAS